MDVLKTYLINCMFHGWAFVADARYHWTERIFWTINIIGSWFLAVMFMMNSYYQFQNDSVSFTTDTLYLNWTTDFPSLIFCEKGNENHHDYANKWFKGKRNYDMDEIFKDIAFFKGTFNSITYNKCTQPSMHCPASRENFVNLTNSVRSNCTDLFGHCGWREATFDCCNYFLPLSTIYGVCYAINSFATGNKPDLNMKMEISSTGKFSIGTIGVELLNRDMRIFIASSEEVPTYNSENSKQIFDGISESPHINESIEISLRKEDTVNEPEIESLSIEKRNCRYPNENSLSTSKVYSYPACVIECLKIMNIKSCNCTHHLMPGAKIEEICDLHGLFCLSRHYDEFFQKSSECGCESSCIESKISILGNVAHKNFNTFNNKNSMTKIYFTLYPPRIRYIRKVINGYLDLIVYMGGIAGLFAGASVLTIVDFFYYIFIRPYNDAKMKRNALKNTKKNMEKGHKRIPFLN